MALYTAGALRLRHPCGATAGEGAAPAATGISGPKAPLLKGSGEGSGGRCQTPPLR